MNQLTTSPWKFYLFMFILLNFLSFTIQQKCNSNEKCPYYYEYDGDDKIPGFDETKVSVHPKGGRFGLSITMKKFSEGASLISTYAIHPGKYKRLPKDPKKTSINPKLVDNFGDIWLSCSKEDNFCNTTCIEAARKSALYSKSEFMEYEITSPCEGRFITTKDLSIQNWRDLKDDNGNRVCKKSQSNNKLSYQCALKAEYLHAHTKNNPQGGYNAIIAPIRVLLTWFLRSTALTESKFFTVRSTKALIADDGHLEGSVTIGGKPHHYLSKCKPSSDKPNAVPFHVKVKRKLYGYEADIRSIEKREKYRGSVYFDCNQEKCIGGNECEPLKKAYFQFKFDISPSSGSGSTEFLVDPKVTQGDKPNPYEIPTPGVIGNGYEYGGIVFSTRDIKDFIKKFFSLFYCRIDVETEKRDSERCGFVIQEGKLVNEKLRTATGFIYHDQDEMKKLGFHYSLGMALKTSILKKNGGRWIVDAVFQYEPTKESLKKKKPRSFALGIIDTEEFAGNPPKDRDNNSPPTFIYVIAIVSSGIGVTLFVALVATLLAVFIKRRKNAYNEIKDDKETFEL